MGRAFADEHVAQVLIADDPSEWVNRLARQLSHADIELRMAGSGSQSLEIIRGGRVRLAVIAADVPRLGGLVLVRQVQRLVRDLPVILIGGRCDRHWLETALRLRARTILPRPVNVPLILQAIGRTLNLKTNETDWGNHWGAN